MRFKAFIDNLLKKNKRQKITMISVVFIVYVMLLAGIFSYFQSEDMVTNRMEAKNGSVTIIEPEWDRKGQYKARASEPGMEIEKDPKGHNNGQNDLYIRLKMTIDLGTYTAKNDSYEENFPDDDGRRIDSILKAIKLENDNDFLNSSLTETNNSDFKMDTKTQSGKTVYYFYYTNGDTDNKMCIVKPDESTSELFDHLEIPIYKKDYLGVFDQPYSITLTAEGIPSANYPDGLTFDEAKAENGPFKG